MLELGLTEDQQQLVDTMLAESDSLALYLNRTIERVPYSDGAGITPEEILQGYLDFCHQQHWQPQIDSFKTELAKLMAELFGASLSHNLERYGKSARGYRMVAFIDDQPDESDLL